MSDQMSEGGLERVVATLQQEEQGLAKQVEEARDRLDVIVQQHKRVVAGLAALNPRSRPKRKGITTEEVRNEIQRVQRDVPGLGGESLKQRVADSFRAKGRALTGFPMRFDQAVQVLASASE